MDIKKIESLITNKSLVLKLRLSKYGFRGVCEHVGGYDTEAEVAKVINAKSKGVTNSWKVEQVFCFKPAEDAL
jgi:hypothetical protein